MNTRTFITKSSLIKFQSSGGSDQIFQDNNTGTVKTDNYFQIVMKLIPSEIVTTYMTLFAFVSKGPLDLIKPLGWFLFLICLLLTPVYLYKIYKLKSWYQHLLSATAFITWAMAIGCPLDSLINESKFIGSFFTFIICLIIPLVISKK